MSLIPIDEAVHFDVATHRADTGAVTDADAPPTFDVFEEATDTPILDDQAMTKRTSLTGNYRGTFTASAANGFEAGKWYSVVVSATVNSVAAKHVAMGFRVAPAESSAGVPKVDVTHYGGTAGTFASGRPEVNASHIGGSSISQSGGFANVNVEKWNTTDVPAEHTAGYPIVTVKDGTGTGEINTDAGKIVEVSTLTGHTPQTGDNFARLGAPAGASVSADIAAIEAQTDDIGVAGAGLTAIPDSAGVTTLLSRIPAALFSGITSLAQWLGLIAGKQTGNSTARTELRATGAGSGTFDETTDSQEALRDRGDAAWTTATGFSTHTAADVWAVGTRRVSDATNITSTGGTTVPQTGDAYARLGAPAGASVSADIAEIEAQTDDIGAAGAGLTALASAANLATAQTAITAIKAKTDNLPEGVQKNTALSNFMFKMVDSTDHVTGKTGLTITATRSLDGAAFAACANSATEIGGGTYKINLAAADLNGDVVALRFTASGADATEIILKTEA